MLIFLFFKLQKRANNVQKEIKNGECLQWTRIHKIQQKIDKVKNF